MAVSVTGLLRVGGVALGLAAGPGSLLSHWPSHQGPKSRRLLTPQNKRAVWEWNFLKEN